MLWIRRHFSILVTSLVLWSCQNNHKPALIVIAVDDFSTEDVACAQDSELSPDSVWLSFCREGVRFTHAYTTSTVSAAAMGSILTGMYPFQHGLRWNTGQRLSLDLKTIAEEGVERGWRTSFFSGGSPLFRKTGVHQGFEYFDDTWSVSPSELHKPFSKNISEFQQWFDDEASEESFMSVFYVADLAFTNTLTTNQSLDFQLDDFERNLHKVFSFLKKKNRWDDTYIVIVGLHGRSDRKRVGYLKGTNLHGENTQVSLLMKWPGLKQSRQIDQEVNLSDVGATLKSLLSKSEWYGPSMDWPTYSLIKLIESGQDARFQSRPLLIESPWEPWVLSEPWQRAAVIQDHFLFLFEPTLKVFNPLVDRYEMTPLVTLDAVRKEMADNLKSRLENLNFSFNTSATKAEWRNSVLQLPTKVWLNPAEVAQLIQGLNDLRKQWPQEKPLKELTLRMALESEDWKSILRWTADDSDPLAKLLQQVAQNQFRKNDRVWEQKCFELAQQLQLHGGIIRSEIKKCGDPLFAKYLAEKLSLESIQNFERYFEIAVLRELIRRQDLALQLRWDPRHLDAAAPTLFEIFLALPENSKLRGQLFRRTQIDLDQ